MGVPTQSWDLLEHPRFAEVGFARGRPSIGYGMTETNAYGPQNAGDGTEVAVGERGEICFKGPHLIRGYWNRPDATAEAIVDGDGFVYVEDRVRSRRPSTSTRRSTRPRSTSSRWPPSWPSASPPASSSSSRCATRSRAPDASGVASPPQGSSTAAPVSRSVARSVRAWGAAERA